MPRESKGPHLWLRKQRGRKPVWIIKDTGQQISTGCGRGDRKAAERELADYIARKYKPQKGESTLARLACADVLIIYLEEHAPNTNSEEFLLHTAGPAGEWWGDKTLADVRGATCRQYIQWRTAQGVSVTTAWHDLKTLRAAINYYHREYGPLDAVPIITLPKPNRAKERWLTRSEAARLLLEAHRGGHVHLARFILISLYTGTRATAALKLRWIPSTDAGWFDLETRHMHRKGIAEEETKKRRPTSGIPRRLLPHLVRWQAQDMADGVIHCCPYFGRPVTRHGIKHTFARLCAKAGLDDVTPHTLRHTCATWLLQAGVPIHEVAGFMGMSTQTLIDVYGHHHPDYQERALEAL